MDETSKCEIVSKRIFDPTQTIPITEIQGTYNITIRDSVTPSNNTRASIDQLILTDFVTERIENNFVRNYTFYEMDCLRAQLEIFLHREISPQLMVGFEPIEDRILFKSTQAVKLLLGGKIIDIQPEKRKVISNFITSVYTDPSRRHMYPVMNFNHVFNNTDGRCISKAWTMAIAKHLLYPTERMVITEALNNPTFVSIHGKTNVVYSLPDNWQLYRTNTSFQTLLLDNILYYDLSYREDYVDLIGIVRELLFRQVLSLYHGCYLPVVDLNRSGFSNDEFCNRWMLRGSEIKGLHKPIIKDLRLSKDYTNFMISRLFGKRYIPIRINIYHDAKKYSKENINKLNITDVSTPVDFSSNNAYSSRLTQSPFVVSNHDKKADYIELLEKEILNLYNNARFKNSYVFVESNNLAESQVIASSIHEMQNRLAYECNMEKKPELEFRFLAQ